jgi:hypothetical protein
MIWDTRPRELRSPPSQIPIPLKGYMGGIWDCGEEETGIYPRFWYTIKLACTATPRGGQNPPEPG